MVHWRRRVACLVARSPVLRRAPGHTAAFRVPGLAEATGARIGAIGGLRWSDITYNPPRIRWRAEFDKKGRERVIPIRDSLVQELRRFQAKLVESGMVGCSRALMAPAPGPATSPRAAARSGGESRIGAPEGRCLASVPPEVGHRVEGSPTG